MKAVPGRALLGLGSNIGDREAHLAHALRRLAAEAELTALSPVYETEPVGYLDQPSFLNLVVAVRTALEPRELLDLARRIEGERARERPFRGAPRTLDIDLLLYGDREEHEPGLEVPHPRMHERAFVLAPLLDVDPGAAEPGTGRPYADYLSDIRERAGGAGPGLKGLGLRRVMNGEKLLDDAND